MSVDHKILRWIETEIFEGRLALGENLPDDRALADAIKSSHNSTREALKLLETQGVLRLYEGKRKTIIPHLVSEPTSALAPALRLHMAAARHPMRDLVQTRLMIEPWAVSRAQRQHPALEEMARLLDRMQTYGMIPNDFHKLEVEFHIALTKVAGNHLVTGLLASLSESMLEYSLSLMGRVPLWSSTASRLRAEYQAIYSALLAGDNEMARQLVISNIQHQYEEAEIDLDEETGVANEMPGSIPVLEPVEIEVDDSVPDEWEEAVAPDIISALENLGDLSAPVGTTGISAKTARPSSSGASLHPDQAGERAEAEGQTSFTSVFGVDQDPDYIPASERNILRAPNTASGFPNRKRRGSVTAPVRATIIEPINRALPADPVAAKIEAAEAKRAAQAEAEREAREAAELEGRRAAQAAREVALAAQQKARQQAAEDAAQEAERAAQLKREEAEEAKRSAVAEQESAEKKAEKKSAGMSERLQKAAAAARARVVQKMNAAAETSAEEAVEAEQQEPVSEKSAPEKPQQQKQSQKKPVPAKLVEQTGVAEEVAPETEVAAEVAAEESSASETRLGGALGSTSLSSGVGKISKWLGFNQPRTVEVYSETLGQAEDDFEAQERARKARLAALTGDSEDYSQAEEETSYLPQGYEYAEEDLKEPEIIDETAHYDSPSRSSKKLAEEGENSQAEAVTEAAESKADLEQKVHSINKNVAKKKKKKRR